MEKKNEPLGALQRVERLERQVIGMALAVGAGNVALMVALGANPLPMAQAQLVAGGVAMALHGWGAWEIGRALRALAQSAHAQALAERIELARWAQLRARKVKPNPSNR